MSATSPNNNSANAKYFDIFKFVGPMAFAAIAAYGAVTWKRGSDAQEIINMKHQIAEQQKQLDYNRGLYATKESVVDKLDGVTRMLQEMQNDIREQRRR